MTKKVIPTSQQEKKLEIIVGDKIFATSHTNNKNRTQLEAI